MALIWLFSEYRDAVQKIHMLEQEILKQRLIIDQLSAPSQSSTVSVDSLLKDFQDVILSERPYPDNKVPESAYLTPSGE